MEKKFCLFICIYLTIFVSGYCQNIFYSEPIKLQTIVGREFNELKLEGFYFFKNSIGEFPSFTHLRIIKKIKPNTYIVLDNGFNRTVFDTIIYSYDNNGNLLTYNDRSTIISNKYSFLSDNYTISSVRAYKIRNANSFLNTPDTIEILTKYFYNQSGKIENEIKYDITDTINHVQKTDYQYDSLNNLIKKIEFDKLSNDTSITFYTYKDNLLIEEEFYSDSRKIVKKFVYDQNKRLLKVKGINPSEIKYDSDGRVIYLSEGYLGYKPLKYAYANGLLFRISTGEGDSKMYYLINYK